MDDRITRISAKIKNLGLKMNPVLSEQEVHEFEVRNNIQLPCEYRKFLTQIGNGGDGPPHYKLYTLEEAFNETKVCNRDFVNFLELEFPLTQYWVWEAEKNWTEEKRKVYRAVHNGILFLGTEGCARFWSLIITGPLRGQVWDVADVGAQPCAPNLSFLEWYEYWLDGGRDWWRDFYSKSQNHT